MAVMCASLKTSGKCPISKRLLYILDKAEKIEISIGDVLIFESSGSFPWAVVSSAKISISLSRLSPEISIGDVLIFESSGSFPWAVVSSAKISISL